MKKKEKAAIEIGQRAAEEVNRLINDSNTSITMFMKNNGMIRTMFYKWDGGECVPSIQSLKKLYYAGADVMYIIFGERKDEI